MNREGFLRIRKKFLRFEKTNKPIRKTLKMVRLTFVTIKEVDLEHAIAWRHDAFSFKEEPLGNIMNELSRWYDVHIFYLNPAVKKLHFTAWFRRNSSLEEVIDILKKTQKINVELSTFIFC